MKSIRKILFPFAAAYYLITLTRNWLYSQGWLSSTTYNFPVICVGNLNTGGTGKSPMTEYLIAILSSGFNPVILSRGYGRKTKGFKQVKPTSTPEEVGDEPLQFAKKFSALPVFVCEDRREGITQLQKRGGEPEVLVLDDAFQHRAVNAGFNIVLTAYDDLYVNDYLLPVGNLREPRRGARRADVIVVTKCPLTLTLVAQKAIAKRLAAQDHQQLFFAGISYSHKTKGDLELSVDALSDRPIRVITGIANPKPFIAHLHSIGLTFEHKAYSDHHNFTSQEIAHLDRPGVLLTTEKDYMRLEGKLQQASLCYLPIKTKILNDAHAFEKSITAFVEGFN
ncbi:MAG: tetraacyldisaccharide 4'-kinase [Dokdonia sp.]|jgi:tetraacyldisaccharide 4'-kinase